MRHAAGPGRRRHVAARQPTPRGRRRRGDAARGGGPGGRPRAGRRRGGARGAALVAAGGDPDALALSGLARIIEGDGKPELRIGALELASARFRQDEAKIAVAAVQSMLARHAEQAAIARSATECWRRRWPWIRAVCRPRARCAATPPVAATCAGGRRDRGRVGLPAGARAPCPAIAAGRRAGEDAARGEEGGIPHRRRAIALLRAVLAIDSGHEGAFEQLRDAARRVRRHDRARGALAARIAVAANPFEVTSLRLARAELLAEKLAIAPARGPSWTRSSSSSPNIRARSRGSPSCCGRSRRGARPGEIYLRRATVEREPAALREIFLRLGHIYRERVPDARRAITAFERVRGIEPDNREALQALSDLYVDEGDTKQALPVTERLVAIEPDAKQRTAYRVRLGELLMRAGDLRRAGTELRRAVDGDPRNVAAVTALAQLLERSRDVGGRRSLLDHSVGLLRHDVERGELNIETLRRWWICFRCASGRARPRRSLIS
jgi:tetratricopeptide (TPR) repeat protein